MTKQNFFTASLALVTLLSGPRATAQTQEKQIIRRNEAWVSINSTVWCSGKWGFITDLHMRRNHFFRDPDFYFARVGVDYRIAPSLSAAAGYAHTWQSPSVTGWKTFSNENRLFEQLLYSTRLAGTELTQRIRNEQRWQQIMINDKPSGQNKFSDRVRLLVSVTRPVFKDAWLPAPVISDELCVQFGQQVVYNTFDQNRLFLGVKERITRDLSFDIGYMEVKQELSSGYQYDLNRTFRLFFYYVPGKKNRKS